MCLHFYTLNYNDNVTHIQKLTLLLRKTMLE